MDRNNSSTSRREFLAICSAAGVGSTFFAGTLYALTAGKPEEKVDSLRDDRVPSDLWLCSKDRGHGIGLDDGQAWSHLSRSRRLRASHADDLRSGWRRLDRRFGPLSL